MPMSTIGWSSTISIFVLYIFVVEALWLIYHGNLIFANVRRFFLYQGRNRDKNGGIGGKTTDFGRCLYMKTKGKDTLL